MKTFFTRQKKGVGTEVFVSTESTPATCKHGQTVWCFVDGVLECDIGEGGRKIPRQYAYHAHANTFIYVGVKKAFKRANVLTEEQRQKKMKKREGKVSRWPSLRGRLLGRACCAG